MHDVLKAIIDNKRREVDALKRSGVRFQCAKNTKSFKAAIQGQPLSIIGEIKRKSPSKGTLSTIADPTELLTQYRHAGVCGISVLTDYEFFGGTQDDLKVVVNALKDSTMPVLRKEFIIDPIQIEESLHLGANAVLLIVAVLQERTGDLLRFATSLGLDALVEVHTKDELELAIDCGADLIGINNRNLHDFSEDLTISLTLRQCIPEGIVTVSASAIRTIADIKQVSDANFDAALIGEGLVTLADPNELLGQYNEQSR